MVAGRAVRNHFYYWTGLIFLGLAKLKHTWFGYTTPKPFDTSELNRCVEYDVETADGWLRTLTEYVARADFLRGKHVLELGPGSDLGIGMTLLARGAGRYTAIDVNNLIEGAPPELYECLFSVLRHSCDAETVDALPEVLRLQRQELPGRLNYVCSPGYDIAAVLEGQKVDIFFSQAAFEHFDDIENTISQMSRVASSSAVVVMSVDLRTHSRWIRDKDPANIYRYPEWLYRLFNFRGIPNRVRPERYRVLFEKYGWKSVRTVPLTTLDNGAINEIQPFLAPAFRGKDAQMEQLTFLLCARRNIAES